MLERPNITYKIRLLTQKQNLTEPLIPAETWLTQKVQESKDSESTTPHLPKTHAGEYYTTAFLNEEQQFVMFHVLQSINQWLYCQDMSTFKHL